MLSSKQANRPNPQREFVERMRRESVTDPRVPLSLSTYIGFPEKGPTVVEYFRNKARKLRESATERNQNA
jgi:hypothetical protein